jgi:hypothetical protein
MQSCSVFSRCCYREEAAVSIGMNNAKLFSWCCYRVAAAVGRKV